MFSNTCNQIKGTIQRNSKTLYKLSGKWSDKLYILDESTKKETLFFSVADSVIHPKMVTPEQDQEEFESRR
jgi:hypothetical protein